jgi:hypothetical protein
LCQSLSGHLESFVAAIAQVGFWSTCIRKPAVKMDAVRAELKQWEKSFKAREGRAPGKADIKADAAIGELQCACWLCSSAF